MAVYIVLWPYLLTTKLKSVIRHSLGHSNQALRAYFPNILWAGAYVAWWFQANGISNRRPAFAIVNWKKTRCNIICQIRKSVSKGNPYRVEIHLVFGKYKARTTETQ